jgi:hypothetical protein
MRSLHLIDSLEDKRAKTTAGASPPLGPGFPRDVVEQLAKLEIWGSGIKDAGPDYVVFKAFDGDGKEIRVRTIRGY